MRVLAEAQRRADPRACGAVAGVLFVCGLSFGVAAACSAQILVPVDEELVVDDVAFYVGGAGLPDRLPWNLGAVVAAAVRAGLFVTGACRLVSASLTARLRSAVALDHLRTS